MIFERKIHQLIKGKDQNTDLLQELHTQNFSFWLGAIVLAFQRTIEYFSETKVKRFLILFLLINHFNSHLRRATLANKHDPDKALATTFRLSFDATCIVALGYCSSLVLIKITPYLFNLTCTLFMQYVEKNFRKNNIEPLVNQQCPDGSDSGARPFANNRACLEDASLDP